MQSKLKEARPRAAKTAVKVETVTETGMITVKVTQLGKDVVEVREKKGKLTAGEAIKKAGFSAKGLNVQVNGKPADLKQQLKNGDTVVLAPKINGG